jgi:hypothetical protein
MKPIYPKDYEQLKFLCWNIKDNISLSPEEVLSIYERNWRWIEVDKLQQDEKELIQNLVHDYGRGVLLT